MLPMGTATVLRALKHGARQDAIDKLGWGSVDDKKSSEHAFTGGPAAAEL